MQSHQSCDKDKSDRWSHSQRMECDSHQPAISLLWNDCVDIEKCSCLQHAILDELHDSALLDHIQPRVIAVGEGNLHWLGQACCNADSCQGLSVRGERRRKRQDESDDWSWVHCDNYVANLGCVQHQSRTI